MIFKKFLFINLFYLGLAMIVGLSAYVSIYASKSFGDNLGIILTMIIDAPLLLFAFGIIGPAKWRGWIKGYLKWRYYDAQPFFPLDPNKNFSNAIAEGLKNFLPTANRLKNSLLFIVFTLLFWLIVLSIFFFILPFF